MLVKRKIRSKDLEELGLVKEIVKKQIEKRESQDL